MKVNDWISTCNEQALETRKNFGISLYSPIDIMKLLRDARINVIIEPLMSNISGFFLRNGRNQLVFINSAKTKGHQSFTGAHEFYHIKYDLDLSGRACTVGEFDKKSPSEFKADIFAAFLLAPDEAINFHIHRMGKHDDKLTYNNIIELEQYFGLSHRAMLNRLKEMELITPEELKEFRIGVTNQALRSGYDITLYQPTLEVKILSDYAQKALYALEKNLITEGKYEELLLEGGLANILYGEEIKEEEIF